MRDAHSAETPGDEPRLVIEECLLAEDIFTIQHREPANWCRYASTAEYAFLRSNPLNPYVVLRTHSEWHNGQELVFCLLAFPPLHNSGTIGMLFGELAISPSLFDDLIKPFGMEYGVPSSATVTCDSDDYSLEANIAKWMNLLARSDPQDSADQSS